DHQHGCKFRHRQRTKTTIANTETKETTSTTITTRLSPVKKSIRAPNQRHSQVKDINITKCRRTQRTSLLNAYLMTLSLALINAYIINRATLSIAQPVLPSAVAAGIAATTTTTTINTVSQLDASSIGKGEGGSGNLDQDVHFLLLMSDTQIAIWQTPIIYHEPQTILTLHDTSKSAQSTAPDRFKRSTTSDSLATSVSFSNLADRQNIDQNSEVAAKALDSRRNSNKNSRINNRTRRANAGHTEHATVDSDASGPSGATVNSVAGVNVVTDNSNSDGNGSANSVEHERDDRHEHRHVHDSSSSNSNESNTGNDSSNRNGSNNDDANSSGNKRPGTHDDDDSHDNNSDHETQRLMVRQHQQQHNAHVYDDGDDDDDVTASIAATAGSAKSNQQQSQPQHQRRLVDMDVHIERRYVFAADSSGAIVRFSFTAASQQHSVSGVASTTPTVVPLHWPPTTATMNVTNVAVEAAATQVSGGHTTIATTAAPHSTAIADEVDDTIKLLWSAASELADITCYSAESRSLAGKRNSDSNRDHVAQLKLKLQLQHSNVSAGNNLGVGDKQQLNNQTTHNVDQMHGISANDDSSAASAVTSDTSVNIESDNDNDNGNGNIGRVIVIGARHHNGGQFASAKSKRSETTTATSATTTHGRRVSPAQLDGKQVAAATSATDFEQPTAIDNDDDGQSQSQLKLSVDWINERVFVVHKQRLLSFDFEGDHRRVHLDDFRPIPYTMKVDPCNGYVFWLTRGERHNAIYRLDMATFTDHQPATGANNGNGTQRWQQVSSRQAIPIVRHLPRNATRFFIDYDDGVLYVPVAGERHNIRQKSGVTVPKPAEGAHWQQRYELSSAQLRLTTSANGAEMINNGNERNRRDLHALQANEGELLAFELDGTNGRTVIGTHNVWSEETLDTLARVRDMIYNNEPDPRQRFYWLTSWGELCEQYLDTNDTKHSLLNEASQVQHGFRRLLLVSSANQPRPRRSASSSPDCVTPAEGNNNTAFVASVTITDGNDKSAVSSSYDTIPFGQHSSLLMTADNAQMSRSSAFSRTASVWLGVAIGVAMLALVALIFAVALRYRQYQLQQSQQQQQHCGLQRGTIERSSTPSTTASTSTSASAVSRLSHMSHLSHTASHVTTQSSSTNTHQQHQQQQQQQHQQQQQTQMMHLLHLDTLPNLFVSPVSNETNSMQLQPQQQQLGKLRRAPEHCQESNKLYIPSELLHDDKLGAIPRIAASQLAIDVHRCIGRGHFGTVFAGILTLDHCNVANMKMMSALVSASDIGKSTMPRRHSSSCTTTASTSGHGSVLTSGGYLTPNHYHCNCSQRNIFSSNGSSTASHSLASDHYSSPSSSGSASSSTSTSLALASNHVSNGSTTSGADTHCTRRTNHTAMTDDDTKSIVSCTKIRVAVKQLKEDACDCDKRDFLEEAKLLSKFDHPNIVKLIGICVDRGAILHVMELMLGGDLNKYLQACHAHNQRAQLTLDDLLTICLDVADGCCYLEQQRHVHRDLAARNCLVSGVDHQQMIGAGGGPRRVVKLADFGLARDIYKKDYYRKRTDSAMPVKWLAPESLNSHIFTTMSDVWSFGVLVWEIMTFCQLSPYPGKDSFDDIRDHINKGERLEKPDNCPDAVYQLMRNCWENEPECRPSFQDCRAYLMEIREHVRRQAIPPPISNLSSHHINDKLTVSNKHNNINNVTTPSIQTLTPQII
ncbi:Tyrosine-protein kinase transforming protein ros, partial [Fragariocoptes setiger]